MPPGQEINQVGGRFFHPKPAGDSQCGSSSVRYQGIDILCNPRVIHRMSSEYCAYPTDWCDVHQRVEPVSLLGNRGCTPSYPHHPPPHAAPGPTTQQRDHFHRLVIRSVAPRLLRSVFCFRKSSIHIVSGKGTSIAMQQQQHNY